jgi:transcriptional regulator with XRE-family HTH domain
METSVGRIGDFIKEQRETAKLSLRRLAEEAGVSNPYLSQVERGLRKPSAEILQQLAKALRISAETLYVQAGLLEDKGANPALESAVLNDPSLNERQKRVLLDIYASFLAESAADEPATTITASQ